MKIFSKDSADRPYPVIRSIEMARSIAFEIPARTNSYSSSGSTLIEALALVYRIEEGRLVWSASAVSTIRHHDLDFLT